MTDYRFKGMASVDRFVHSRQAKFTFSISPVAVTLAYLDWVVNLANSPGKQYLLLEEFTNKLVKLIGESLQEIIYNRPAPVPSDLDPRFREPDWQQWPFNFMYKYFLLFEDLWRSATTDTPGVSEHHQNVLHFLGRQILDLFSPSNCLFTNPVVLKTTFEQGGANLLKGLQNLIEDQVRRLAGLGPAGVENFQVGKNVAVTPGKVVYYNRLMELIQYSPSTEKVYAEPILFVPAWIMKYYILDLSPHNSLVKYLVDKGHTVFMISWKNPTPDYRQTELDDYRKLGVMEAIEAISNIVPGRQIHTVGYCLGGTILVITAATMARDDDHRLKTMTLLAAQTDFTEAGELMLFIDENQVNFLEDIMWDQGYLDAKQMAGAFQVLRSNDLIWSRMVREYLMGERAPMTDLMAWNADSTRMPYRMHSQYLRQLFLNNDLAEGRYQVEGREIALRDICVPVFIVATVQDHVAPWRSVYKFNLYADPVETTFVLTTGGHNAGIISEPTKVKRTYRLATRKRGEKYVDPDTWFEEAPEFRGSWWIPWQEWLVRNSSPELVPPPPLGLEKGKYRARWDAPGKYVFD
ncbi:MAG: alpha/beta fold hydrolase [Syntrophales bacterium]|nr:alpha/beta fold hydrolase [Syntrophales bacterium]